MEFAAGRKRWRDEHERDVALAWHIAMLERQKSIPSLPLLLQPKAARRGQTPQQMRIALGIMAEVYGFKLRTVES